MGGGTGEKVQSLKSTACKAVESARARMGRTIVVCELKQKLARCKARGKKNTKESKCKGRGARIGKTTHCARARVKGSEQTNEITCQGEGDDG